MPTTKNALLRYKIIDKCMRNTGRSYSFGDIKSTIEEELGDINPDWGSVSDRTLRKDIEFMRSTDGYDAPIENYRDGKYHFMRYSEPTFSINKVPINQTEAEKIKSAIAILQRFEGGVEFNWLNEIGPILNDFFGLKNQDKKIIGHDFNEYYSGNEFFSSIFDAISNEQVLKIEYKTFKNEEFTFIFHPYFLKQYNNRWFVFGYNEENSNPQWNVPLDRIVSIKNEKLNYRKDDTDWPEYFSDMIGVTKPEDARLETVVLRCTAAQTPYLITKPMHESQRPPISNEDGTSDIRLKLVINYELKQHILSFGSGVTVIEPVTLRDEIKSIANEIVQKSS
jgi:predicted DNA-binding transcriptional regulator YafY